MCTALPEMLLRPLLQQPIEAYRRPGISLRYNHHTLELKAVREADERLAGGCFSAEQHDHAASTSRSGLAHLSMAEAGLHALPGEIGAEFGVGDARRSAKTGACVSLASRVRSGGTDIPSRLMTATAVVFRAMSLRLKLLSRVRTSGREPHFGR
jgi:hypothetical protein